MNISKAIVAPPLTHKEQLSVNAKQCTLSFVKLPLGGLHSKSVVHIRITDSPNMTSAVNHGCKATNQTSPEALGFIMTGFIILI